MQPLLIATGNPHKVHEIRAVLSGAGLDCVGLDELQAQFPEPAEDGATFEDNARIKALAYAHLTGRICLADDSGLEVDALDGRPGVHSARYAASAVPEDATRAERDEANNRRLLTELDRIEPAKRTARFVCALCVATPTGRIVAEIRGNFEGRIGSAGHEDDNVPRGTHGFGYDPLFLVAPEHARTSAELLPEEKNAISHRGLALAKLAEGVKAGRFDFDAQ